MTQMMEATHISFIGKKDTVNGPLYNLKDECLDINSCTIPQGVSVCPTTYADRVRLKVLVAVKNHGHIKEIWRMATPQPCRCKVLISILDLEETLVICGKGSVNRKTCQMLWYLRSV